MFKDINSFHSHTPFSGYVNRLPCIEFFPEDLINDLESFGIFFEDLAVRNFSVYAGMHGAERCSQHAARSANVRMASMLFLYIVGETDI